MKELEEIWDDQCEFNAQVREPPQCWEEKCAHTKEYVLGMMSELDELLRTTVWKPHRSRDVKPNDAQTRDELTDLYKYWVSLCIVWGVSPQQAIQDYWRKSMVVRQRFAQELVEELHGPIALVDIDGVLADYFNGFLDWFSRAYPHWSHKARRLRDEKPEWFKAGHFDLDASAWADVKHEFATEHGFMRLDPLGDAHGFLKSLRDHGYTICLVTSRPIDKYPTVFGDTVQWLNHHGMCFDVVWWTDDKARLVALNNIRDQVAFAVDDDPTYVDQYQAFKIKTFHRWVPYFKRVAPHPLITEVASLMDIPMKGVAESWHTNH